MKRLVIIFIGLVLISTLVLVYAYMGTWGSTELEFRIHINKQLVQQSAFGESPTFAIWLENPQTGVNKTIFVTRRAATGDWEGKAHVPVALPRWFEVYQSESTTSSAPTLDKPADIAITGATPHPGYFTTRVRVEPESKWICWIEMNLSGDYNEHFQEVNREKNTEDEFGTGQPALLYRAEIQAVLDKSVIPQIEGMSVLDETGVNSILEAEGITTAAGIFNEISISVVKPKPRILSAQYQ